VAMRDLMGHLRDTGEVRGGGPTFSKQDRSRFLSELENAVQASIRAWSLTRKNSPDPD